jgi:hypothetical protein
LALQNPFSYLFFCYTFPVKSKYPLFIFLGALPTFLLFLFFLGFSYIWIFLPFSLLISFIACFGPRETLRELKEEYL